MSDTITEKEGITHSQRNYKIFFLPVLIILVILFLREITGSVLSFLISSLIKSPDQEFFVNIMLNIVLILIMLTIIFILVKFRHLKFNRQTPNKGLGLRVTILTYLVCFGLVYVITIFYALMSINNPPVSSYQVITLSAENFTLLNVVLLFTLLAVLAPVFEELVFRRLFIPYLESGYGTIGAILISSITFGLIHTENDLINGDLSFAVIHLINAFILGLGLGFVYIATRNIIYPIIFHGFNNFFPPFVTQVLLAYFDIDLLGSINQPGYSIIALLSLILLAEMIIGIGILAYIYKKKREKVFYILKQVPLSFGLSRKFIAVIGISIIIIFTFFTVIWPVYLRNFLSDNVFHLNGNDFIVFIVVADLMIFFLLSLLIVYYKTSLANIISITNPIINLDNEFLKKNQLEIKIRQYGNETKKYCIYCGSSLIDEAKFCVNCGKEIKEESI
ncbi:MAG: CPBP family glutamic-type intramembrane protease [Candidatus Hodarchaeales archaeon]|jgi:membrane protease YdiL (CAAX protease family)